MVSAGKNSGLNVFWTLEIEMEKATSSACVTHLMQAVCSDCIQDRSKNNTMNSCFFFQWLQGTTCFSSQFYVVFLNCWL